jgi:hypothetical protein
MGGHYYATSTLRDTCYGILESFAFGNVVTNSSHSEDAFMLLTRVVAFYESELMSRGKDGDTDEENNDQEMDTELGASCLQF